MDKKQPAEHMHRHPAGVYGKTINKAKMLKVGQLRELVHELNTYRIALETQSEELLYSQKQLSTSEKKYHRLFDLAPFSYLVLSRIGLIEEVNRTFMKMFGVQRAMLINKPFLQYISPESQDIFHEHFRKILKTKTRQNCKLKIFGKDKTSLYVQLESSYIKDTHDGSIRICTAMLDITQHSETDKNLTRYCGSLEDIIKQRTGELQKAREKMENQIAQRRKASKQYYQLISGLTGDCILKINIAPGNNMTIDWTTGVFTKITGYSIKGSRDPGLLEKIVHPKDSLKLGDFIGSIIQGTAESVQLGIITRQGELKQISISVQPDRDHENSQTIGVIGVIKDITERKEPAAAAAGTTAPEMEQIKTELELLSNYASHDLIENVNAITSISDTFIKEYSDLLDVEGRFLMNNINTNSRQTLHLINEMLTLLRVSHSPIDPVDIDMGSIFIETLNKFRSIESGRKITLNMHKIHHCRADITMIKQVISNLISNAVKFTRSRQEAIIKVGSILKDNQVTYYIKDNGTGFDMKYAGKLFEPFRKLHRPMDFEEAGIGLAIAERLIKRHGGHIWARSKVGKGAIFFFMLPEA